ncbi:MAG TPA: ATP-binding protein [Phycisphaerae bacterium]|nr:ATP-binding protein [Phycisphaerae bacterium]
MKLLIKGLLLIAVPTLFELILIGFLFKAERDAASADAWKDHTMRVRVAGSELVRAVLRQDVALRDMVLANDDSRLGGPDLWTQLTQSAEDLKNLVSDNPPQVQRVADMEQLIDRFHTWYDAVIAAAPDQATAIAAMLDPTGRRTLRSLEADLHDFLADEQTLDIQRTRAAADARFQLQASLLIAGIGSLIAGALSVFLFSRGIAGRLATLTSNARNLAENHPLAPPVAGTDEIADLDEVLHQTALRLADAARTEASFKQTLESRARELADANESLRVQTRDNEMFIYSVSHDLRSPLVNLQGFGKELRLACQDVRQEIDRSDLPPEQKKRILTLIDRDVGEALHYLQTAVGRAAGIIDALLRLSRAGRVEYRRQEVDVAAIVRRVVDAMQSTIRERAVIVDVRDLPPSLGDPTAIEQVFGNLVGNAVNYLDKSRPGQIEIGASDHYDGFHTYYVKDNGMGIPAAYMDKMFRAFQRLHGDAAKGEGIGLALVRRVVERHGGKTWVQSTEGVGTTFFVSLPAWNPAALLAPEPAAASPE